MAYLADDPGPSISLSDIVAFFLNQKFLIMAIGLACFVPIAAFVFSLEKRYASTAKILLNDEILTEGTEVVQSHWPREDGFVDSQVEVLTSIDLVRQVVEKLALPADPEFLPDQNTAAGAPDGAGDGSAQSEVSPAELVDLISLGMLSNVLNVERIGFSYLIRITAETADPAKSAKIANSLASTYLAELQAVRAKTAYEDVQWLEGKVSELGQEVNNAERMVDEFRSRHQLNQIRDSGTLVERQIERLTSELASARSDTVVANARLATIDQLREARTLTETTVAGLDVSALRDLKQRQTNNRVELSALSARYREAHPEIIRLKQEAAQIAEATEQELQFLYNQAAVAVEISKMREARITEQLDEFRKQLMDQGQKLVQLAELERKASVARSIYEEYLERFQTLSDSATKEKNTARIIETARANPQSSFPKVKLLLALGLIMSGVIATGIAAVVEFMTRGVRTVNDAEAILGVSCLGTIDKIGSGHQIFDFSRVDGFSHIIQKLRLINSKILAVDKTNGSKVVLVSSSVTKEGKSSIALALARAAARSGRKTLLVDGDFYKPSLSHMARVSVSKGRCLEDVLGSRTDIGAALVQDPMTTLQLLLCRPDNRVIDGLPDYVERFRSMIDVVKRNCDVVFIDTPPITQVADALEFHNPDDYLLLVVRIKKTPASTVQHCLDILRQRNVPLQSSLLNCRGRSIKSILSLFGINRQAAYGYGEKEKEARSGGTRNDQSIKQVRAKLVRPL